MQRPNIVLDGNGHIVTKPAVNTEELLMPIGWLPGVHIVGNNNVTVTNITFEGCITGVTVENASAITIAKNFFRETTSGIVIFSSSDVNISGNNITLPNQSFGTGIQFLPSNPEATNPHHITIETNTITGTGTQNPVSTQQPNQYGIKGGLEQASIVGYNFTNIKGIALYHTGSSSLIVGYNFQNNSEGIVFYAQLAANNTVYANNFDHNGENAVIPFIRNIPIVSFDNGTIGNYWSDYNGTDLNGDGIGDTPYVIETTYYDYELKQNVTLHQGQDNYPLMAPWNGSLTPEGSASPTPTATPSTTASLSPSPSVPEFPTETSLALIATVGLLTAVILKRKSKADKRR